MRKSLASLFVITAASTLLGCGGDSSTSTSTSTSGDTSSSSSSSSSSGTGGSGGSSSTASSSASTGTGSSTVTCPGTGAEITSLPTCGTAPKTAVTLDLGCEPTVDGVLHKDEWSDATCFNVAAGDLVVAMKYAADALYFAVSGPPTCGCPMGFYFSPASGKDFVVSVFDDPFNTDGDRTDFSLDANGSKSVPKDASIVVLGPGMQPMPVRYEWKIPYATLGIQKGGADSFKLAIIHASAAWPAGLDQMNGAATYSADEPTWGVISAPTWE